MVYSYEMKGKLSIRKWLSAPKVVELQHSNLSYVLKATIVRSISCLLLHQVLGRTGPFPLILLPQFGGYWIEGTNHEPKDPPEAEPLPCPASHIKLETNSTAKIYRKHFMGKVRMEKGSWFHALSQHRSCMIYLAANCANEGKTADLGCFTQYDFGKCV